MKLHEKINIAVLPAALAVLLSGLIRLGFSLTRLDYYLPYSLQSAVITMVSMSLPIWFYCRSSLFWGRPPLKAAAPITSSTAIVFGCGVCLSLHFLLGTFSGDQYPDATFIVGGLSSWLMRVFSMAVLPAVLEEWLFRGCILPYLERFDRRAAVLLSALLFALIHHGWQSILFAFAAGVVLGCIRLTCGSVWGCVIVHLVNNTAVLCVQAMSGMIPPEAVFIPYCVISFICMAAAVAAAIPFYRELCRAFRKRQYTLSAFGKEMIRSFVFWAYVLNMLLLNILNIL